MSLEQTDRTQLNLHNLQDRRCHPPRHSSHLLHRNSHRHRIDSLYLEPALDQHLGQELASAFSPQDQELVKEKDRDQG